MVLVEDPWWGVVNMKKEQIILIALIVLVVLAGVQSFEMASIREDGVIGVSAGSSSGGSSSAGFVTGRSTPSSGSPMVGGC